MPTPNRAPLKKRRQGESTPALYGFVTATRIFGRAFAVPIDRDHLWT